MPGTVQPASAHAGQPSILSRAKVSPLADTGTALSLLCTAGGVPGRRRAAGPGVRRIGERRCSGFRR
jgi:hypothetical protein